MIYGGVQPEPVRIDLSRSLINRNAIRICPIRWL